MPRLSEILRFTQDDMVYHEVCFLLIVHHSVDSVLPVELQLITTMSIPNIAFCLALGADAPIHRQPLSERSELG